MSHWFVCVSLLLRNDEGKLDNEGLDRREHPISELALR